MHISLREIARRMPGIRLADIDFQPRYRGHLSEVHCATLPLRLN